MRFATLLKYFKHLRPYIKYYVPLIMKWNNRQIRLGSIKHIARAIPEGKPAPISEDPPPFNGPTPLTSDIVEILQKNKGGAIFVEGKDRIDMFNIRTHKVRGWEIFKLTTVKRRLRLVNGKKVYDPPETSPRHHRI